MFIFLISNLKGIRASSKIKRGAVPCIPNPKKAKEENKTGKTTVVPIGASKDDGKQRYLSL